MKRGRQRTNFQYPRQENNVLPFRRRRRFDPIPERYIVAGITLLDEQFGPGEVLNFIAELFRIFPDVERRRRR